ncbi:Abi family protein [Picosynechococcus sp. PCC 73109]|uniref:Abi family protein n=1 Tax=Picosynechococcus sp. PCC 73109 TaxID=374982 RepID=UPI000AB7061D|nr:Abi family protein [Picosynechococcus sp. PCC 73109]
MLIKDTEQAKFYLQHLNYYRLRAYWLFFERNTRTHQFQTGTRFQDVLDLYIFDRELRLLILDAIERIEVSVRSQWAYYLAHRHGSHAHLDQNLFNRRFWQRNLNDLTKEVNRSEEDFVQHFQQTYSEALPPVWVVCEVMSFGLLSRWFKTIRFASTKAAIATAYNVRANFLESWLHHLAMVRNTCVHHSRLWNREFTVVPTLITSPRQPLTNDFVSNSRKIYNSLVILLYLMDQIAPNHQWGEELLNHIKTCPQSLSAMDFPSDWESRQIWKR